MWGDRVRVTIAHAMALTAGPDPETSRSSYSAGSRLASSLIKAPREWIPNFW